MSQRIVIDYPDMCPEYRSLVPFPYAYELGLAHALFILTKDKDEHYFVTHSISHDYDLQTAPEDEHPKVEKWLVGLRKVISNYTEEFNYTLVQ